MEEGQTICLGLNKQTGTLVDTTVYFARIYELAAVVGGLLGRLIGSKLLPALSSCIVCGRKRRSNLLSSSFHYQYIGTLVFC